MRLKTVELNQQLVTRDPHMLPWEYPKEGSQAIHGGNQERGQHEVQAMAGRLMLRFSGKKFARWVLRAAVHLYSRQSWHSVGIKGRSLRTRSTGKRGL